VEVVDSDGIVVDASNFKSNPVSFQYYRSTADADLIGEFFFTGTESIPGTYTASLVFDGTSANEFTVGDAVQFTTLSASSPLLAPSLSSAQFSNNGASLFMIFGDETDYGRLEDTAFVCGELFEFIGANLSSCIWLNLTTVEGTFPTYTSSQLASPGDVVTLRGGKVRSACQSDDPSDASCDDNELAAQQSVASLAPKSPTLPEVVLNAALSVSICDNLAVSPFELNIYKHTRTHIHKHTDS
jgi:hypothetical protein